MTTRTTVAATAALCAWALTGCSGSDQPAANDTGTATQTSSRAPMSADPPSSRPSGTSSSSPAPTSSTSESGTKPTDSSGTGAKPTGTSESGAGPTRGQTTIINDSPPARARRSLVPRAAMPTFQGHAWVKDARLATPGRDAASVCSVSTLTAIGGVQERSRRYGTDRRLTWVRQTSVVFPDSRTARRSAQVLDAWFGRCDARARHAGLVAVTSRPGPVVGTRVGSAHSQLTTFRTRAGGRVLHVHEGWVRDGDTLSYVVAQHTSPMSSGGYVGRLLKAAGARLLQSR